MFVDKARHIQNAGAIGGIVFDNNSQSSADTVPLFSMSGDGLSDITIPLVFLFGVESRRLMDAAQAHDDIVVYIGELQDTRVTFSWITF
jgi:mannosidase alpha-like ER degradation enhancer 3